MLVSFIRRFILFFSRKTFMLILYQHQTLKNYSKNESDLSQFLYFLKKFTNRKKMHYQLFHSPFGPIYK